MQYAAYTVVITCISVCDMTQTLLLSSFFVFTIVVESLFTMSMKALILTS